MDEEVQLKNAAIAAIHSGQLDQARPLWSQLCETDPLDPDNWIILSAIDEKLGFLPAALDHLKYAHHLTPDDPDVWMQSARIRWELRDFDGALGAVANALCIDFTDRSVRRQFAHWLMQFHKFELALVHFRFLLSSGEQVDTQEAVAAMACALCAGELSLAEQWWQRVEATTSSAIAETIASSISDLQHPHSFDQLDGADNADGGQYGQTFRNLLAEIRLRLKALHSDFSWQEYFDRRAHIADQVQSDTERTAMRSLADQVIADMEQAGMELPQVLDLGCGTGRLGDEFAQKGVQAVLTGIDRSQASLHVASRKNRYDNLVMLDLEQSIPGDRVGVADFIIIAEVLEYCHLPAEVILALLAEAKPTASVYLVWDPSLDSEERVGRAIESICAGSGWLCKDIQIPERSARVINGSARPPAADKNPAEQGVPETISNQLVHASQLLDARQYQASYDKSQAVLAAYPQSSQALFNLGVCAQSKQQYYVALNYFRRALSYRKGYSAAWFQIGAVYQQLGGHQKSALRAYHNCLKYAPEHFTTLNNLFHIYTAHNNHDAAWQCLRQLLLSQPLNSQYLDEIKALLERQPDNPVRQRLDEFLQSNDWIKAQFGSALNAKYLQRAKSLISRLEDKQLDDKEITFYRVQVAEKAGDLTQAKKHAWTLIHADPANTTYWQSMASACAAQGRLKTASRIWKIAASKAEPNNALLQNRLFTSNYWSHIDDHTLADMHLAWGEGLSNKLAFGATGKVFPERNHERLRIGYVSGDLRMHSVSIFLYNLLKYRDREQFEVYCYSSGPNEDNMSTKLRLFSDFWRDIHRLSDETVAGMIECDEIDILVDLAGHTAYNRLPLFCRRPAPVQCTYLGYANSSGLKEIDFRITDPYADPPGMTENFHSERLIRLPHGFLSYSRMFGSTPITILPERHATRHYTFACCNNVYKVNDGVIEVWSEILRRLPNARLLIKAHNLNNTEIVATYQKKFEQRGVAPNQVHLMNTLDIGEHQDLYNHVDIALDPFPYNGTTTTCDALWMGVPVLVLAGTRHAGRVGVSILSQVGLTDWIAKDELDYVEKAVAFAQDTEYLQELKLGMRYRVRSSALMRPGLVTRDLERAFKEVWCLKT